MRTYFGKGARARQSSEDNGLGDRLGKSGKRGVLGRFLASRGGASAAEFALVFPVFMLALFAITSFASTLFIQNNMINAARESARHMSVLEAPGAGFPVQCDAEEAGDPDSAEGVACAYLTFWGTDFTVTALDQCPAQDRVTVTITVDASEAAIMDVFGFFNDKTLTADVSMRREDPCVT